MITLYVGTPGAGKSFEAVKLGMDTLRVPNARKVYTNIEGLDQPENRAAIKAYTGIDEYDLQTRLVHLPEWQVKEFWRHVTPNSLIIIDEAQNYWNSRDYKDAENRGFGTWASTHRHHGYDLVLLTQCADRIDRSVRVLAQWTYKFRKLDMFGEFIGKKGYRYWVYPGSDDDVKAFGQGNRQYDPRIFACYKSYVDGDTREIAVIKPPNMLRHPIFFAIPLLLVAFVWMFSKSSLATGDLFGTDKALKTAQAQQKIEPVKIPGISYGVPSTAPAGAPMPPIGAFGASAAGATENKRGDTYVEGTINGKAVKFRAGVSTGVVARM